MTEDSTRGEAGGQRDTTQMDLRHGVAVQEPGPAAGPGRDTTQIDLDRIPSPPPAPEEPQVRTVERHVDEILAAAPQVDPIELAVLDAQGLLCAEDVVSRRALPAFDQAALDGYAVRAADIASATLESPVQLAVVGETFAGAGAPASIGPGLAQKV